MNDPAPAAGEPLFEVVTPLPRTRRPTLEPAAALTDLSHRRVGFAWDQLFRGDVVFEAVSAELARTFDGVTAIGYEQFGDIHGADERRCLEELPDRLRQLRVDALVVGIGA
jgi:hypothetical protein